MQIRDVSLGSGAGSAHALGSRLQVGHVSKSILQSVQKDGSVLNSSSLGIGTSSGGTCFSHTLSGILANLFGCSTGGASNAAFIFRVHDSAFY